MVEQSNMIFPAAEKDSSRNIVSNLNANKYVIEQVRRYENGKTISSDEDYEGKCEIIENGYFGNPLVGPFLAHVVVCMIR